MPSSALRAADQQPVAFPGAAPESPEMRRGGPSRPETGTFFLIRCLGRSDGKPWEETVNGLIYLVGLIVVILIILSFLGLR